MLLAPDLKFWLEWRASLPPVPSLAELRHPQGTKYAMRAALTEVQGRLCALCLSAPKRMVLDHDHISGLARGMLCPGCNGHEGASDSLLLSTSFPESLLAAYRANPPAAGCGWIWDSYGVVGKIMLKRARLMGQHSFSTVAESDLIGLDYEAIASHQLDYIRVIAARGPGRAGRAGPGTADPAEGRCCVTITAG